MAAADMGRRRQIRTYETVAFPSDNCGTIYKKTVLILGTGDIGSSLAHRLKAFDTSIIGFRRHPNHRALPDFDEVIGSDQLDLKRDMLPPLKSQILKWGLLAQWLY